MHPCIKLYLGLHFIFCLYFFYWIVTLSQVGMHYYFLLFLKTERIIDFNVCFISDTFFASILHIFLLYFLLFRRVWNVFRWQAFSCDFRSHKMLLFMFTLKSYQYDPGIIILVADSTWYVSCLVDFKSLREILCCQFFDESLKV